MCARSNQRSSSAQSRPRSGDLINFAAVTRPHRIDACDVKQGPSQKTGALFQVAKYQRYGRISHCHDAPVSRVRHDAFAVRNEPSVLDPGRDRRVKGCLRASNGSLFLVCRGCGGHWGTPAYGDEGANYSQGTSPQVSRQREVGMNRTIYFPPGPFRRRLPPGSSSSNRSSSPACPNPGRSITGWGRFSLSGISQ